MTGIYTTTNKKTTIMKQLAIALYTINKRAKELRDIVWAAYNQELNDKQGDELGCAVDEGKPAIQYPWGSYETDLDEFEKTLSDPEDEGWDLSKLEEAAEEVLGHTDRCTRKYRFSDTIFERLQDLNDNKKELYELKHNALGKLNLEPTAYHKVGERCYHDYGDDGLWIDEMIAPMYEFEGFSFHGNSIDKDDLPEEHKHLYNGKELGVIDAENKLDEADKISLEQAIKTLTNYLTIN